MEIVQLIHGPDGFVGQRDPRAAKVEHLKCHDCQKPVFVRWFYKEEPIGYSCDDKMCWPVAVKSVE